MKMDPTTFAQLRAAIAGPMGKIMADGEVSPERARWDALWASGFDAAPLYLAGLNDDHIDTALRKIARELESDR